MSVYECSYPSPIGTLVVREESGHITRVYLDNNGGYSAPRTGLLTEACRQLDEYFSGRRQDFGLPTAPKGTAFQQSVWDKLTNIPYGKTACYQDIAAYIGNIKASRAVGQAVHNNPIMIIIPCHRVISKDGSIGGFACGTAVKEYLLGLEKNNQG
ncbi:MAG: methylated-DNA--[protein]-cysteine S-methyltransferase [Oscillospiraceae bacterium]